MLRRFQRKLYANSVTMWHAHLPRGRQACRGSPHDRDASSFSMPLNSAFATRMRFSAIEPLPHGNLAMKTKRGKAGARALRRDRNHRAVELSVLAFRRPRPWPLW